MDEEKDPRILISLISFLLRAGLAVVFLYAAVASFIEPDAWIGYLPIFLRHIFPASLLLSGFSTYQILLSLWLLSGKKTLYAASLSALTLVGIIFANVGALDVIFRDFAILFSAVALAALSYR